MRMLRRYLRLELDEIDRQSIKFQTIGRTGALAENVRKEIQRATERTARNKGMVLTVALNYGGRAEIVDAAARQSGDCSTKAAVPMNSPKNASRTNFTRETCRSWICWCAPAVNCEFQTFFSGKAPTARSTSRKLSGPTSAAYICSKRSSITSAAIDDLED